MGRLRRSLLIATLATVALLTAACGDDAGDAPSAADATTPASSSETASPTAGSAQVGLPACDEVWVADADLPEKYDGCTKDGATVEPETVDCSSGQRIVLFDDHYWAVRGHVIKHAPEGLSESSAYADVLYSCRA